MLLLSLATAAALGAGHALTPGHGKSLMAAYLVGTRGTPVHAIGLGLSVSASHTLGILALAAVIIGAQGVLNPDLVVRTAPLLAAAGIVAIGAWMLVGAQASRRPNRPRSRPRSRPRPQPAAQSRRGPPQPSAGDGDHRHVAEPVRARSGGRADPSTSALLILLGAIAGGRPAFGVVLVVAFGLGMAAVMTGIGIALILARGRIDGLATDSTLGRLRAWLPLAAACLVLGIGLYLTVQAVAGPTTF